ncbi:tripartite tricarboxylate transporter permease [Cytobacillus sp. FSL R5-0569]|uniref:tripartite tricarboxylate transporter permease n=1 Tax=Cytobacillus sp. FSL R5-0569 TaxID=2921649 RepID=UPI0030F62691
MELLSLDFMSIIVSVLVISIGLFVGMFLGALPGLGLMLAISLLLPLSYALSPLHSILLLLACYQGSEYGGSISAILLGIPGTAMAAATKLDGQPYAQKKSPGKALAYSLTASTIGGLFGGLVLIFLSKPIANVALKLGDPEYFLIGLLGLVAVASLGVKDKIRGFISIILGFMTATIGLDLFTGQARFTGGFIELMGGINLIAVVVGLFAFTEIFQMLKNDINKNRKIVAKDLKIKISIKEYWKVRKATTTGSIIGAIVGIIPGLGANASSWFAYLLAKKTSKKPEEFGNGSAEGIVAPESANNAVVGGSLLPLLTLGIPGSASIAIIAGAFIIHGIQPGPHVLEKNADLINAIFIGFLFTTIGMYIMGKFMTGMFAKVLVIKDSYLIPSIIMFSLVGVYTSYGVYFDLWVALVLGVLAYILKTLNFSVTYFILAFVLAPIIESSLRRSLSLSQGSYMIFVERPISLVLLLIVVGVFILTIVNNFRNKNVVNTEGIDI